MSGLSERAQRFVEAYLGPSKGNAADAARRAGYKAKDAHAYSVTGARLLASVGIRQAITEAQQKTRRASIADIVEIHETLTDLLRTDEVAPSDRIKAGVELAKMRGQYAAQKLDVEVKGAPVWLPDNGRDA